MMRSLLPRLFIPAAALLLGTGLQPLQGSTLFWNNDGDNQLLDSSGNALTSDFSFELGVFNNGFVPTADNIDDWGANWMVMDRAFDATPGDTMDPDAEGWDSALGAFTGTVNHLSDGTSDSPDANPADVFVQGTVMYIWVYNTRDRSGGTAEWALVTDGADMGDDLNGDDWIIPDPMDPTSYNILLRDADSAVLGNIDGTTGGGQPYNLQTIVVPVPEPGSALLAGGAILGGLLSRRRRHV